MNMDNENNMERISYIDIIKGIAILSVVFLHVDFIWPFHDQFRIDGVLGWAWHVSVFFVIGGFFLKEDKLVNVKAFVTGKVKSLYKLALYIYLPATLVHNILFKIGWYSTSVNYGGKIISHWTVIDYIKGLLLTFFCAGREPIVGAMWFVYVLLFALCGYSIITFLLKKTFWKRGGYETARFVLLLALQVASCMSTNMLGFTIPRFSNAVSVMLLICIGQILNRKLKLEYNNIWLVIGSLLVIIQSVALTGVVGLNHNNYHDVLQLDVVAVAALYVIGYLSKKLDGSKIGNVFKRCGKDSFYIMGLHIVGFKLLSMLLIQMGIVANDELAKTMTPRTDSPLLLCLYTLAGMAFPLCLMSMIRKLKSKYKS